MSSAFRSSRHYDCVVPLGLERPPDLATIGEAGTALERSNGSVVKDKVAVGTVSPCSRCGRLIFVRGKVIIADAGESRQDAMEFFCPGVADGLAARAAGVPR
jgi:hypothetical protein